MLLTRLGGLVQLRPCLREHVLRWRPRFDGTVEQPCNVEKRCSGLLVHVTAKSYEIEPLFRAARLFKLDWPVGLAPAAFAAWAAAPERGEPALRVLAIPRKKSPTPDGLGLHAKAARHPVTHYGPQDAFERHDTDGWVWGAGAGSYRQRSRCRYYFAQSTMCLR